MNVTRTQMIGAGTATAVAGGAVAADRFGIDETVSGAVDFAVEGGETTARNVSGALMLGLTLGGGYYLISNGMNPHGILTTAVVPLGIVLGLMTIIN